MPYWKLNMKTGVTNGVIISLSEAYNGALEYYYLSEATQDPQFKERTTKIRNLIKKLEKPRGCYIRRMNVEIGKFWGTQSQLFRDTKDFLFTLLKETIQSGGQDREAFDIFIEAMDNSTKPASKMLITSRTGLNFLQGYDPLTKKDENCMEYEACVVPGMWCMGAHMLEQLGPGKSATNQEDIVNESKEYWQHIDRIALYSQLSKSLANTCKKAHSNTQTHLAPRKIMFTATMDASNNYWGPYDKQYHLRWVESMLAAII